MKKILLPFLLLTGLSYAAQAQASLIRLGVSSIFLAKSLRDKKGNPIPVKDANPAGTPQVASTSSTYEGQEFPMQRTAADQLPKKGADQVVAMEAELERCHAALLASPTGVVCSPEQRAALQTALTNVAHTKSSRNLAAYQQEAAFYAAQDARRQQAPTPAEPAN